MNPIDMVLAKMEELATIEKAGGDGRALRFVQRYGPLVKAAIGEPVPTDARVLTFDAFRQANIARCVKWHPEGIQSWSPSDWLVAVTGELGELASLLKMRNRERDGLAGNKFSPTDKMIADELADVQTYLDLLAAVLGVDLGRATVAKFNEVSERVGFPDRIALVATPAGQGEEHHKLDTETHVFFYEQDFYVLSNFSAFTLQWKGRRFDTSEAAYHWEKFDGTCPEVQEMILDAPSAHAAFKLAESQKAFRRHDWDAVKLDVMRNILREKATQHEYVRRKLLATGARTLVEDSWRDDYWGWGQNRNGNNWLGRLWMEVRAELVENETAPRGRT